MDCETNTCSFLIKRRQMVERNHKSRRQQIFNRTRKILAESDHLQTTIHSINTSQILSDTNSTGMIGYKQQQLASKPLKSDEKNKTNLTSKKKWQYYKNFQYPEWMIQIPQNLDQYYFCARPVGQKVFIRIKKYKMLLISMYGQIIETFPLSKANFSSTLFEGYFIKEQNHLIISDLLVWKQNPMSSSEFEFRLAWLLNNFSPHVIESLLPQKNINIKIMDFFNVNKQNLITVYEKTIQSNEKTDGFLFYDKDSFYLHEVNPAVYLWKDIKTAPMLNQELKSLGSKYDKMEMPSIYDQQECQKQLNSLSLKDVENHFYGEYSIKDGILYSYDKVPLVKINPDQDQRIRNYHNKCIVKFTFESLRSKDIKNEQIFIKNQNFLCREFEIQGQQASQQMFFPYEFVSFKISSIYDTNSRIADPLSKIIWKHNYTKNIRISFEMILIELERKEMQESSHGNMDLE